MMDKIEPLIQKIDSLLRSEIWVALMLLYQSVLFLFFTDMAFSGTAFGIVIPVGLLAASVLLEFIMTKSLFKKENLKPLMMALLFGIAAIIIMLFPKRLSVVFHYGFAVMLIADGILGIMDMLHFRKIHEKLAAIKMKGHERRERSPVKKYDDAVLSGISDQKNFMLKPLDLLKKRTKNYTSLAFVMNIIGIAMGVILVLFHNEFGFMLIRVSGVCLFFIGAKDLILALRVLKLKE